MNWRIALVVGVFVMCATSAHAQFDSANISGVVQDTTGAILPGVDVTLTNVGTKIARQAVTNEAGLYTFPNVPVGEYQITARLSGFKPITKSGVQVNAGLNIRVDVALEIGARQRDDSGPGRDDAGGYVRDRAHRARRADRRDAAQRTARVAGRAAGAGRGRRQHGRLGADRRRHVRDRRDVDQRRPRRRVHDDDRRRSVDSRPRRRRLHDGRAELRHRRRSPGADDELSGRVRPVVGGSAAAGYQERHAELPRQHVLEPPERRTRRELPGRGIGAGLEKSPHKYNAYGFTLGGPIYIPGTFNSSKQRCSSSGARSGSVIAPSKNRRRPFQAAAMRNGDFSGCSRALHPDPLTGLPFPGNMIPPTGSARRAARC